MRYRTATLAASLLLLALFALPTAAAETAPETAPEAAGDAAGDAPGRAATKSAAPFSKAAEGAPTLLQSGPERHWCPVCGMKLALFWKTSHAARLHDGGARQYCSIHCLAADLPTLGGGVADVRVVDAATGALVPAATARYVVDSDVPGTMSAVSKLAFADAAAAAAFRAAHGGRLATYDEALKLAREGMAKDRERLQAKKRLKVHPMGKKLWATACAKEVDPDAYTSIGRLKVALASDAGCPGLPEPKLQAVARYLWDVVRADAPRAEPIPVPEGAKCPVCGMFVVKYPHWVATVVVEGGATLYFDGVKDLAKYVLAPATYGGAAPATDTLRVTDYYTLAAIDGRAAHYVVGSDVRGPMGHELIPFASAAHAETFRADHGGERVVRWDDITPALLEALDARK